MVIKLKQAVFLTHVCRSTKLGGRYALLTTYVDDIVITGPDKILRRQLKEKLMARFTTADLGEVFSHLRNENHTRPEQADTPYRPNGLHALHPGSVQHEGLQPGKHTKYGC